ncbi:MAG: hypothetical protein J2P26_06765 [Nocardiopsaceae bacterium]|nr:hypothetical protein [Nocardiopsaceae bacterium]
MKVRIGVSLGAEGAPGGFAGAVDQLEAAGIDSLWLPERVYADAVEPLAEFTDGFVRELMPLQT